MRRALTAIVLSLIAFGGASAGPIFQPSGNFIATDLTQAQVGTCAWGGTFGSPVPCNITSTSAGTYMTELFTDLTNGVPSPSPSIQAVGPITHTIAPFIFNQENTIDPNTGGYDDTYLDPGGVGNKVVVDLGTCSGVIASLATCGLFNIADIYTMVQAYSENYGDQDVTITLNGTTANGATPITDTIIYTAGVDVRTGGSFDLGAADCTVANAGSGPGCTNESDPTAVTTGVDTNPAGTPGANKVVVYNNVFGSPDTDGTYNYYMDVQEIETGLFVGAYLNSVSISGYNGSDGSGDMLFSGLTFQQYSPEPGTVCLTALGAAFLVLLKIRRSRATA